MTHSGFGQILKNGGWRAFLAAQFLGAFNDSVYQTVVALRLGGTNPVYVPLAPAVFTLPSLLFSGYAGHLADAVSKRKVLIGVKTFEIAIMLFGLWSLYAGWTPGLLGVVFLMGVHAAVFSPAKYGIVPEILGDRDLSRGNALLEMSTFVSIVLGIAGGGALFALWRDTPWRVGVVTLAVSLAGLAASFWITRTRASGATAAFRWNPFAEIGASTARIWGDRPLWLAVLGISYFWFAGVLLKTDLQYFGLDVLHASDNGVAVLWAFLAVGVGVGNLLAGRLSGDKVELGLVPLGALLMALFSVTTALARHSFALATASVTLLAVASGLFVVPLYAYVQQRSDSQEKGRVVAANNFYQTLGMLAASGLMSLAASTLHLGADTILVVFGFSLILVAAYIMTLAPDYFVRFTLWLLTHTVFRIRIVGAENVPFRGPALLVANHVSHADGFLIGACVQRFIRFMVWKPYYEIRQLNWFFRLTKAIPVGGGGPREVVESLRTAREELAAGHVVCIFAEGAITRTGNMLPFKSGLEKIARPSGVPVIPVHLDRVWGSIFSFEGGKFFWKWPKRIPYPVTVSFGAPLPATATAHEVRQAIQELSAEATARRATRRDTLGRRFLTTARRHWKQFAMADSTGRQLTCGEAATGALLLGGRLAEETREGEMVGLLLPSTVAGALVNLGLTLRGRIPVNLNFTAGREAMAAAIAQCEIRTIVTSRIFVKKLNLEQVYGVQYLYVEDLLKDATAFDKARAYVAARRLARGGSANPHALATVIFSSGSTGVPKGVALTHYNVIANIEAIRQLFWITGEDRIVGVLPFFHSFGFTVTLWFPTIAGCGVIYHPNPTDASAIGELVGKYKGTLLLATPTFLSTYTRKCTKEQFASLRYVLAGAEKLRDNVASAFREKFGVDLLEGYGCTEMSPVVAVNAPTYEAGKDTQIGAKPGTVGNPLPGVAARIVDPATYAPLGPNTEGLLLVKGANRMQGYLAAGKNAPANPFHDGWYVTGDIAVVDDDGFLKITDRLSRFSKIGGEMVPHLKVEEAVLGALGEGRCSVTGVPDEQRGERLVVLYVAPHITPAEIWQRLNGSDMPRLWIPKRDNIYPVEALPELATGKLDLRAIKQQAQALTAEGAGQASGSTGA